MKIQLHLMLLASWVLVLLGCSSSDNLALTHLDYVQQKYANAVTGAMQRPSYAGLMSSNVSSASQNGRIVHEDMVVFDGVEITYITYSFLNDTVLTTGSLDSRIGAAVTEVWRRRGDRVCRVLTTQSNGDPMLPFSVASADAWIKKDDNNQITYRLYVGTSEGVVGKISFVDQNPLVDNCEGITNEAGQGHFTILSHSDIVAPVNNLKLGNL